jgi:carbon-monoxide dehydrogenase catalytic subunit
MVEKKALKPKKEIEIKDLTICDATQQMLEKARRDGVETAFDQSRQHESLPHRCRFGLL